MAGVSTSGCSVTSFANATDVPIADCLVRLQASFLRLPYARGSPANTRPSSLIKRNYVFLTTVFVGAFAVQMSFDSASDKVWDSINRGRQWKDIKHKYVEGGDDE
ncbi:Cytochrome b-c1 complex subunit 9 [Diplodia seriata]|uniref:Complex III subunit 9 n=1 Tax=Diplodia seriata TaxID=420778 RepID=A0A1S8B1Z4_9PEZI|nr:Cytochrome b-c1 complex subunit 9 [Diplodia seriata]